VQAQDLAHEQVRRVAVGFALGEIAPVEFRPIQLVDAQRAVLPHDLPQGIIRSLHRDARAQHVHRQVFERTRQERDVCERPFAQMRR
jgi:hypothetical protein